MSSEHTLNLQDGTKIFYRDSHPESYQGLTVIALAGLTRNSLDFEYLVAHFDPKIRLIRIDSRGRGHSDWSDPSNYTVAQEAADVLEVMDQLAIERAAFIGTSRGGLISMSLAYAAVERIVGVLFNDIGPVLEFAGLQKIGDYLGVQPQAQTLQEMAEVLKGSRSGFNHVPDSRWLEEAQHQYLQGEDSVELFYDPALRDGFVASMVDVDAADIPPIWALFDLLENKPLAVIRGESSDILSAETVVEMQTRRPDILATTLRDRAHVPFLDEPEALETIRAWLDLCQQSLDKTR
ncbi:MAG: alpha/beta hydrolase [Alcaligenaceae bacterium]|nr:alpha/beta hydrolase [Alcaligenaceae bacterium]